MAQLAPLTPPVTPPFTLPFTPRDATAIAQAIRQGQGTAVSQTQHCLDAIAHRDPDFNCFTAIFPEAALQRAEQIDQAIALGLDPGPLAGVPFAVKNLFDIAGQPTLAGSIINADAPPARQDATAIARLTQAGAILLGHLNMDEYAYGFVTENAHYGATRNPYDLSRIAGGSSGGSAAAVAAQLVPLSLGSDTNGSIRVPAALCGVWGLKPTYGRLSRAGVFPLAWSLDHIGPFSRSVRDLALVFDLLQGPDPRDPVCTSLSPEPTGPVIEQGITGLRLAIATGYFQDYALPEVLESLQNVAQALGVEQTVELPEVDRARAAAFLITACEGGHFHRNRLRDRPQDFDPATRDRFLAGALMPSHWYLQAQRFRRWYRDQVLRIFDQVDVILTPTTPCPAPLIGQTQITLQGEAIAIRPFLGMYTQPISLIGLPALSIPIQRPGQLPLGIQAIAAPYQEEKLLRVARYLERAGIARSGL